MNSRQKLELFDVMIKAKSTKLHTYTKEKIKLYYQTAYVYSNNLAWMYILLWKHLDSNAYDFIFVVTTELRNSCFGTSLCGLNRPYFVPFSRLFMMTKGANVIKFFYLFRSKEYLLFKVTLLLCSKSRFIIGVNENELNSIITGDKLLNIYLLVVVLFLLNDLPFMTNKSST